MSTILVVEPYTVLQHAIVVAFFPEHQIRIAEAVPDSPGDADIVIVDATALRERSRLSSAELRRIFEWDRPIIWIDGVNAPEPNANVIVNLVRLGMPLKRDELKTTVAECLNNSAGTPSRPVSTLPRNHTDASARAPGLRRAADREVIELTEVYEDSSDEAAKRRQKE
jgi:hypothetical protein